MCGFQATKISFLARKKPTPHFKSFEHFINNLVNEVAPLILYRLQVAGKSNYFHARCLFPL